MIPDFGFYNMDCMEGMKQFPDKYFELAIVDPPYGINIGSEPGGATNESSRSAESETPNSNRRSKSVRRQIQVGGVSASHPKRTRHLTTATRQMPSISKNLSVWQNTESYGGGNYFLNYLNATECIIVWDKKRRGLNFADCEVAWTDIKLPCRIVEFKWNGMLQEDMKDKEFRIHPTQKPVKLYEWLLRHYAKEGDKILDTHVGSASSLIACQRLGFRFVGYEIDEDYYKLAKERYERETAQITLFNLNH